MAVAARPVKNAPAPAPQDHAQVAAPRGRVPFLAVIALIAGVYACSIYANLSFAVKHSVDYRYFPPFRRGVNLNMNRHLGGEYINIAQALTAGRGFSDPFSQPTGPTAWMPPLLPGLQAAILWLCDGDRDAVMAVIVFLQVNVLIATGLLVLALARQTTRRLGTAAAVAVYLAGLLCYFQLCFQFTHDCWFVLLAVDLLIAGLCWWDPLHDWKTTAVWGLFGGLCAMTNPIVALAWGLGSFRLAVQHRTWSRLAIAALVAGLTLAPWTIRNYRVFGRWIPVKSNVGYELYQSQCLQPDGLIRGPTFEVHPFRVNSKEGQEYKALGEIAYLEKKREQFWQAVRADPVDFCDRVASRFLGATLWYEPMDRMEAKNRPWVFWSSRLTHPLPFLAMLVLVFSGIRHGLQPAQWIVIGVYLVYLLPYIGVSYYDRYAVPLLGVKVLLVIWAADRLLWRPSCT